jgi:hypothetical protein
MFEAREEPEVPPTSSTFKRSTVHETATRVRVPHPATAERTF